MRFNRPSRPHTQLQNSPFSVTLFRLGGMYICRAVYNSVCVIIIVVVVVINYTARILLIRQSSWICSDHLIVAPMLVKNFPTFHGTWRSRSVCTISRLFPLFWTTWIQPTTSHTISLASILGAFVNQLLKVSISVSPSVRLYATTRLPLVGFLWNSIFRIFFSKHVNEFQVWLISDKISWNFTCIST